MIELTPQDTPTFQRYLAQLADRYTASIAESWQVDDATARLFAEHQLQSLLPQGENTLHHQLRNILHKGERVGAVWYSDQPGSAAYVYDIVIDPAHRRQGLATHALTQVETLAKANGCIALSLHVFQHNPEARRLYEKLGLGVIGVQMYKAF